MASAWQQWICRRKTKVVGPQLKALRMDPLWTWRRSGNINEAEALEFSHSPPELLNVTGG